MKILVCIKQVVEALDNNRPSMNRFDEYALEEAICIKEKGSENGLDIIVDVITLGPWEAVEVVKRAFGLGADNGFHIVMDRDQDASSSVTAELLARAVKDLSYDLVLTGIMSQDRMEGQTGPILAEIMGIPCATGVIATSPVQNGSHISVEREMEKGERQSLMIRLPALLTVQAGINTPRYPSLSKVLKASKKMINTIVVVKEEVPPDTQTTLCLEEPAKSRSGRVLAGTTEEKAMALFSLLRERGIL